MKSLCETCIFKKLCKESDTEVFECDYYKGGAMEKLKIISSELPVLQVGLSIKEPHRKLLKSSKVRKWLKETEQLVNKELRKPEVRKRIKEAVSLGVSIDMFLGGSDAVEELLRRRRK